MYDLKGAAGGLWLLSYCVDMSNTSAMVVGTSMDMTGIYGTEERTVYRYSWK